MYKGSKVGVILTTVIQSEKNGFIFLFQISKLSLQNSQFLFLSI